MTYRVELKALALLQSAELTRDMEIKHLKKLASMASEVAFSAGEVIYQKGDRGRAVYLIEAGEVIVEMATPGQGRMTLNTFGPGQFFGWSSLFPSERKMAWTRAVEPTRAIAINATRLKAACQFDHNLEYAIVRRASRAMADRVLAVRRQMTIGPIIT
jgi:CRP/FNR family cyclic AMP-dependent transcriptional regulator